MYANLRGARANRAENKRYCKSRVYMKHHPNGNLKNIVVFSALPINNALRLVNSPHFLATNKVFPTQLLFNRKLQALSARAPGFEENTRLPSDRPLNQNQAFFQAFYNVSVKSKLQHPPGQPPGHLTFLKIIVQIPPYPGQNAVQMPHTRVHSGDQMPPPRGHFTGT